MAMKTFDPALLSVVVGAKSIEGFAQDTMLTIEVDGVQYNTSIDIHGNVTRSKTSSLMAVVTITLTQSSSGNDVLSAFAEADNLNNAGVFTLFISDKNGSSLFTAQKAYVEQIPSVEYGSEIKNREWVIRCSDISNFIGGIR
jgi:hypothetical protein